MKILLIISLLFSFLKSQQIDNLNLDDVIFKEEPTLKFRLEYNPRDAEIPIIEYEDIEVPYQLYISSELRKQRFTSYFALLQNLSPKNIKILFGKDNYLLGAYLKNLQKKANLEFNTNFKKILVNAKDFNKHYVDCNCFLTYYAIFDKLVIKNDFAYQNQYVENCLRQINYNLEVSKVFNKSVIFSISPSFQLNFFKETNLKTFFKSNFNMDLFITENLMTNLNADILNRVALFNANITFKNYPIENFYTKFSLGTEKDIKKLYYQTKVYKNLLNFDISVMFRKSLYYEFIKEYFIKFPEINYEKDIKDFPEIDNLEVKLGYTYKNYTINLTFDQTFYSYYPTYIFLDDNIEPYFIENLKEKLLKCKFKMLLKNFSLTFESSYLVSPEELLFTPTFTNGISFSWLLKENLYFEQKFLYNSRTLVDFHRYLAENAIFSTELKYFFSNTCALGVILSLPFNNKNFITPNVYCYPYLLCGVNFKF